MDLSGDDAGLNQRQRPTPPGQTQNIHLDPIQINVTQAADPQVLERLDKIVEMLGMSEEERKKLVGATAALKAQTDKLQESLKTP